MVSFYFFLQFWSFAERARLLCSSSCSDATIGFLVISFSFGSSPSGITGSPCGSSGREDISLNVLLQIRSSSEWNVMTEILPSD